MVTSTASIKWLTLSRAADLLGVHPSTLRAWIDAGAIRAFRTPGGHRRVELGEIQTFLANRQRAPLQQTLAHDSERALVQVREEIHNRQPERQRWFRHLQKRQRARQREIGQRLFGLVIQYAGRRENGDSILHQARQLAAQHGRDAALARLSPVEVVQAFVFFRRALVESTFHPENGSAQIDREGLEILQRINYFMDDLLLATLDAYTSAPHR